MKNKRNFLWIAVLLLGTIYIISNNRKNVPFQKDYGKIFGTIYNITYQYNANLKDSIDKVLRDFDGSMSTFNDTSTITKINRNISMNTDKYFDKVFKRSMEVSQQTGGAFDITVAPLVNAWGFGFKKGKFPDSLMIDSLMQIIGYQKVKMNAQHQIVKDDARIMLDCSAVAKGFAVDVVADYLKSKGIKNYMVDIGGEVVVSGVNTHDEHWKIGINKPIDDSLASNNELEGILSLSDKAIATSGNYRNYYYKDGKKYAHTIDPNSGYPVQHHILSSTVVTNDCMSADAYATSFMVMGIEKAKEFLKHHPEIDVYFIYDQPDGKYGIYYTDGMKKYMENTTTTSNK